MDPVIIMLVVRGLLAALLIGGGIGTLYIGHLIFNRGSGLRGQELAAARLALQSIGGMLMATSVAWGVFGYLSAPRLAGGGDGLDVRADSLTAEVRPGYTADVLSNPVALKNAFTKVYGQGSNGGKPVVTIDDQPATLDLRALRVPDRVSPQLVVPAVADGKVAPITFAVSVASDSSLIFTPVQLARAGESAP